MKVTVWHPAPPSVPSLDEADSLLQAQCVARALSDMGREASLVPFRIDDIAGSVNDLLDGKPDLVFNLVEETDGIQALNLLPPQLLEALALPFTGSGSEAIALTGNKLAAKAMMASAGLPTPGWIVNGHGYLSGSGGGAFLLKPISSDASQGLDEDAITLCEGSVAAKSALDTRGKANGNGWFAERFIDGREFNLGLLETAGSATVLPAAEMCFVDYPPGKPRIVGYKAKWDPESFEYRHTRRRYEFLPEDAELLRQLGELARSCWGLFHLRGYARVDFRVDNHGQPWILEINANPAIAPDAGFIAAAQVSGLSYHQIIDRIAEAAQAK